MRYGSHPVHHRGGAIAKTIAFAIGVACSPSVGTSDDDGSDSATSTATTSTATTSTATDTTATDTTASTSSATTAVDTTGVPPSCEMYTPDPLGPEVSVQLVNQGSMPVYVSTSGCGGAPVFDIIDANATSVPYLLDDSCSPITCDGFVSAGSCEMGCVDCAPPNGMRIDPGAIVQASWPARRITEVPLEPECVPGSDCYATCLRPDPVEAGEYQIVVIGYHSCGGDCECGGADSCPLFGEHSFGEPANHFVAVSYPDQTTVELVITD